MGSSIGWDASTSIVGVCELSPSGSLLWKDHVDLRKIDHLNDKAKAVRKFIQRTISPPAKHFLEDRLGSFSFGKTSQQTLMKLSAFNAIVSLIIEEETGLRPDHIHPMTIKSEMKKLGLIVEKGDDKKEKGLEWVMKREPAFTLQLNRNGKHQPWNVDEADAYKIALTGLMKSRSLDRPASKR